MPIPLPDLLAEVGAKRLASLPAPSGSSVKSVDWFMLPQGETMIAMTYPDHAGYDLFCRLPDANEEQLKGAIEDEAPRSIEIIPLAPDVNGEESYVGKGDHRKPNVYAVFLNRSGSKRSRMAEPYTHGTAKKIAEALAGALRVKVIDKTYPWQRWATRQEEGAEPLPLQEAS